MVSGGTGFIGSYLVKVLAGRGDEVTVLSRSPESVAKRFEGAGNVRGAGYGDGVNELAGHLSGQDAVVNLSGEPAVGVRYTEERKGRIVASRVETTRQLVSAMENAEPRPGAFVCASAVGYYGSRHGRERLDEASPAGDDFLARLCVEWEAAARAVERHGVRVVIARFGPFAPSSAVRSEAASKSCRGFTSRTSWACWPRRLTIRTCRVP
jgi:uncharacterized protein (TIGR01777 family)